MSYRWALLTFQRVLSNHAYPVPDMFGEADRSAQFIAKQYWQEIGLSTTSIFFSLLKLLFTKDSSCLELPTDLVWTGSDDTHQGMQLSQKMWHILGVFLKEAIPSFFPELQHKIISCYYFNFLDVPFLNETKESSRHNSHCSKPCFSYV